MVLSSFLSHSYICIDTFYELVAASCSALTSRSNAALHIGSARQESRPEGTGASTTSSHWPTAVCPAAVHRCDQRCPAVPSAHADVYLCPRAACTPRTSTCQGTLTTSLRARAGTRGRAIATTGTSTGHSRARACQHTYSLARRDSQCTTCSDLGRCTATAANCTTDSPAY